MSKEITVEIQQKLQKLIPEIVGNISGVSAENRRFVFYKDSFCSDMSVSEIVEKYQKGEQIPTQILATTYENNKDVDAELIVASVPATDGWITAFYSDKDSSFVLHGIHDNDLPS